MHICMDLRSFTFYVTSPMEIGDGSLVHVKCYQGNLSTVSVWSSQLAAENQAGIQVLFTLTVMTTRSAKKRGVLAIHITR